jgi:glycosyltransferase involved in cell wall biosynthesis
MKKIVISRGLYERGISLGVDSRDLIYVPNGIDHSIYRQLEPIENRPPWVVMLYHIIDWKGSKDGIRALQLAKAQYPTMKAVLFGIFSRPNDLPSWIEYRCNPSRDELVNSIYNGSSIYVCSSWHEGFGLPPAEAMACGCAVVSTDVEGVRDFAENEVTALLSPPKDPEALAGNIVRLLRDDELRIKLAKAGHERIKEFTWGKSTDLLEQFLKGLMGRPGLQKKQIGA